MPNCSYGASSLLDTAGYCSSSAKPGVGGALILFGVCEDSTLQWEVIKSVGRVVLGAMGYSQDFSLLDSSGDTVDVDAARVLALQQRATELSSNMFEDGVWAEEDMTE